MRVEAARLVRALCYGSDLTLQTLISCGGLAVLTQFLDAGPRIDGPGEAGIDARRLVRIGIDGVLKVFSLQVGGLRLGKDLCQKMAHVFVDFCGYVLRLDEGMIVHCRPRCWVLLVLSASSWVSLCSRP